MTGSADAYYAELARDYDRTIRRLVPRYDEMLDVVVGLVADSGARRVLELGTGPGPLAERLVETLPDVSLVGLDLSETMLVEARRRLAPWGERVTLVAGDVGELAAEGPPPGSPADAVVTSLVLHNLPAARKRRVLEVLRGGLAPGGVVVWADLVRFADSRLQEARVAQRRLFALERGCPPGLVEWNFRKEGTEDHPLTVEESLALAREVGFGVADVAWAADTFAVLLLGS